MFRIYLNIIAILLFFQGFSQEKQMEKSETLVFAELSHDFGRIPQGKPVTHIFKVTNQTTSPILLENVQASCGCTTPQWTKEPIAPGATSEINVGYNAASEGNFEKTITVYYTKGQTKQMTIRGTVWKAPEQAAPKNTSVTLLKNVN
ncbi:MAG: DUF1573 domain-containing protein [Chitinophagaceae bacterium]